MFYKLNSQKSQLSASWKLETAPLAITYVMILIQIIMFSSHLFTACCWYSWCLCRWLEWLLVARVPEPLTVQPYTGHTSLPQYGPPLTAQYSLPTPTPHIVETVAWSLNLHIEGLYMHHVRLYFRDNKIDVGLCAHVPTHVCTHSHPKMMIRSHTGGDLGCNGIGLTKEYENKHYISCGPCRVSNPGNEGCNEKGKNTILWGNYDVCSSKTTDDKEPKAIALGLVTHKTESTLPVPPRYMQGHIKKVSV